MSTTKTARGATKAAHCFASDLEALRELTFQVTQRVAAGGPHLDLVDLTDTFSAAFSKSPDGVVAQLRELEDMYPTEQHFRYATQIGKAADAGLHALLDEAKSAEVAAARDDLSAREDALREALEQLEQAVARGDIETVLQVRTKTEVLLPNEVAKARLALTEAAAAAYSAHEQSAAWADHFAAVRDGSVNAVGAAHDAWLAARRRAESDEWWYLRASGLAAKHAGAQRQLESAAQAARHEAEQGASRRLRRLAGLSEETAVTA